MYAGIARIEIGAAAQFGERLIDLSPIKQQFSQRTMSRSVLRSNRDCLAECRHSFRNHLFLRVCRAKIVGRGKVRAVQIQGMRQGLDGVIEVAGARIGKS